MLLKRYEYGGNDQNDAKIPGMVPYSIRHRHRRETRRDGRSCKAIEDAAVKPNRDRAVELKWTCYYTLINKHERIYFL